MDIESLKRAKNIESELRELDSFIFVAGKVWTGKIGLKKIVSSAYGFFKSEEFVMKTEIKNRVLSVLRDYGQELEKELSEL